MSIRRRRALGVAPICVAVVAVSASVALAQAPILPGLYNTGVASTGTLAPYGSVDPHYALTLSADPAFPGPATYVADNNGYPLGNPWVSNTTASQWISPNPNQNSDGGGGGDQGGEYDYGTSFTLSPSMNASSLVISGMWTADDDGTNILVNGQSTGIAIGTVGGGPGSGAFYSLTPFTLQGDFVPGVNTLDFLVHNNNLGAINPTGLQVDFTSATFSSATPEPGTTGLLAATAVAALLRIVRRRRR